MISYQKSSRLGLIIEKNIDDKILIFYRDDCSTETISDAIRIYNKSIIFEKKLSQSGFEEKLQNVFRKKSLQDESNLIEVDQSITIEDATSEFNNSIESKEDDGPAIQLLNSIIAQALAQEASDIHFEPKEDNFFIKMRLDGNIINSLKLNLKIAPRIISRVKLLARINISERRLPQDGRIAFKLGSQVVDVRVSTIPTGSGERVVLRILGRQSKLLQIDELNMPSDALNFFRSSINKQNGLVLVTGPTGSGKTSTLYSAINSISDLGLNIMTIEDPIEIKYPKITQTQVNTKIGLSFAKGLKAILRQDPDVILIGEIRDSETASVAVQASMTGHLVLSTLHTNSAIGAVNRLIDLGVEPYLLSSSLNCIIAQRLLKKYCLVCREKSIIKGGAKNIKTFQLDGCTECNKTGFRGRIGIFDYLEINNEVRQEISKNNFNFIEKKRRSKGLDNQAQDLVKKHIVPLFEAIKISSSNHTL